MSSGDELHGPPLRRNSSGRSPRQPSSKAPVLSARARLRGGLGPTEEGPEGFRCQYEPLRSRVAPKSKLSRSLTDLLSNAFTSHTTVSSISAGSNKGIGYRCSQLSPPHLKTAFLLHMHILRFRSFIKRKSRFPSKK